MDCNDENVKGFVGYKYPTYACCFFELGVGRILESDILGIATMDCNDRSVKGFVGYRYPTYTCSTRRFYSLYRPQMACVAYHARGW